MMLPTHQAPPSVGEMLTEEFMKPLGLTQRHLATHLGWTVTRLNQIITGKRGVTIETALCLSDAFDTTPEFWLNLQIANSLWEGLQKHQKKPVIQLAA